MSDFSCTFTKTSPPLPHGCKRALTIAKPGAAGFTRQN
jgi:hypothetical protein